MFGRTENNILLGIDCYERIYQLSDILLIASRHVSISSEFAEILRFRHFTRYMSFAPTGKRGGKNRLWTA